MARVIGNISNRKGVAGFNSSLGINMELDARDFMKRFDKLVTKDSVDDLTEGLTLSANQFITDIAEKAPQAPVDTSAMVGSMSAFVNKKLVATSERYRRFVKGAGKRVLRNFITKTHTEKIFPKRLDLILGMNAPYSTVQHETHKTKKNFLENKLMEFWKNYISIALRPLQKRLR